MKGRDFFWHNVGTTLAFMGAVTVAVSVVVSLREQARIRRLEREKKENTL
jgi:hypothetical protein